MEGTRSYRLRILRGGCAEGLAAVYDVSAPTGMVERAMRPPPLPSGRYGFEVSAYDGDCGLLARGCTEAQLPLSDGACVNVLLRRTEAPEGCGSEAHCVGGMCVPLDAGADGAIDGAGPESGRLDGGEMDEERGEGSVDGGLGDDGGLDGGGMDATAAGDAAADAVPPTVGIASLDMGLYHTCVVRTDGSLWCWGDHRMGQLGLGDEVVSPVVRPTRVGMESDWRQVAAGERHTCGIRVDGSLWCWGMNDSRQLGVMGIFRSTRPIRVGRASDWLQVAAGGRHGCGVRTDRSLWCWGRNDHAQLGLGLVGSSMEPQQVGWDYDWTQVIAGDFHSCAVRGDGSLWCWGRNDDGQLGVGDTTERTTPTRVVFP
ncbi:MAG: hypothetical protein RMK74_16575 [Myxococcales bacterium]|nr:hypothetical protein [Myxococcales bacterium]